jgi:integrase
MGAIRVRKDTGKLQIDFQYRKKRCREQTPLENTPANRKKLERALKIIEGEIAKGTFEYQRYFPNSPKVDFFKKLEAQEKDGFRKTPLFKVFAEEWYSEYEHTWRHATAQTYRSYIDKRLIPEFGEMEVSQITKADLLKFRSAIAKSSNETLKPKTINKFFRCMSQIMSEAADRFDFTSPFQNFKALKEQKVHIQPFSMNEVNLILANVRKDWQAYLIVRFFTGMRTGEINGLKWKYVNFESSQIFVRETFSDNRWEYTKNDGSQREIEMSSIVFDALKRQFDKTGEGELVFPLLNGSPIRTSNFIRRIWAPLLSSLNLEYRNPYQTRHTAATLWLAAGENPAWIANQMGHSNTTMLFTIYARFVPNVTRKDGSAMDSLLKTSITPDLNNLSNPKKVESGRAKKLTQSDGEFWQQFLDEEGDGIGGEA